MLPRFQGDLLIGDLNIDPSRKRRRDQEPLRRLHEAGWTVSGGGRLELPGPEREQQRR